MTQNPITLGTPPQFWWERGVWYRPVRYNEDVLDGDQCELIDDSWDEVPRASINRIAAACECRFIRRPIPRGSEPWCEMAECCRVFDSPALYALNRIAKSADDIPCSREEMIRKLQAMTDHVDDAGVEVWKVQEMIPDPEKVIGQWPGDETDEEIEDAMRETGITGDGKKVEQPSPLGERSLHELNFNRAFEEFTNELQSSSNNEERGRYAIDPAHRAIGHARDWIAAEQAALAEARVEVERLKGERESHLDRIDDIDDHISGHLITIEEYKSRAETAEAALAALQGKSSAAVDAWWAMDSAFRADIEADERGLANAIREMEQALQSTSQAILDDSGVKQDLTTQAREVRS